VSKWFEGLKCAERYAEGDVAMNKLVAEHIGSRRSDDLIECIEFYVGMSEYREHVLSNPDIFADKQYNYKYNKRN